MTALVVNDFGIRLHVSINVPDLLRPIRLACFYWESLMNASQKFKATVQRHVVRADEELTAVVEPEAATRAVSP